MRVYWLNFTPENATFVDGADLNGALMSVAALNTVNDLWPSQWEARLVPFQKDGTSFELNHMRRASSSSRA